MTVLAHATGHPDGPDAARVAHDEAAAAPENDGSRKKMGIYCALAFVGIAAVVGIGIGVMPRSEGADGWSWRDAFSLKVSQPGARAALKFGSVPLGIKPESIYALPTRPYFSRASDGRTVAEFAMDDGIYTVWFGTEREGRRAQRVRFARTFEDSSAADILKAQIAAFGNPAQADCNRLLAHQGRSHCRYGWNRPDGSNATMILRSVLPAIGNQRTEMVLTVNPPAQNKNAAHPQRAAPAGRSL